jgi:hypothetical protein
MDKQIIKGNLIKKIRESILDEYGRIREIETRLKLREKMYNKTCSRMGDPFSFGHDEISNYNRRDPTYCFESEEGIERTKNSDVYKKLDETSDFLTKMGKSDEFSRKVYGGLNRYKDKVRNRTLKESEYSTIIKLPKVGLIRTISLS